MTISYDDDQRVPNLNTLESGALMTPTYSISVAVDSDSDSISSQLSNDSADSVNVEIASRMRRVRPSVESSRRGRTSRLRIGAPPTTTISSGVFRVNNTRAAISAMRRIAARIVRKAARNGHKRMSEDGVLRRLMKRDIERRDRYISELREGNRLLELQMRETEAEVERLFQTFVGRLVDPYVYNDDELE
ncbi:hypothetical protein Tcan_08487 [Toxocara canis]|uniref:BZIP domain-containing protein n=2 Tax=Toxocara canis TaxID=6265 RepID=A0A0B2VPV8_TOXCA|nr:hypothetical protein Tcan_08487 [Toxocara canis]VDM49387.1 unnamed protein product [Toxocara canis]